MVKLTLHGIQDNRKNQLSLRFQKAEKRGLLVILLVVVVVAAVVVVVVVVVAVTSEYISAYSINAT